MLIAQNGEALMLAGVNDEVKMISDKKICEIVFSIRKISKALCKHTCIKTFLCGEESKCMKKSFLLKIDFHMHY